MNEEIRPRRIPPQNVLLKVVQRELFGGCGGLSENGRRLRAKTNSSRRFYTNFHPNTTLVNVEKPPCFLRKFTPDGKRFIAFSNCQTQLEIYLYKGPSAANELLEETLHRRPAVRINHYDDVIYSQRMKNCTFDHFFSLEHVIQLCSVGVEQLNRECSLFSEDGDFVIVASANFIPDDNHAPMHMLHRNNESVAPNPRNPLENYTLYSIEIAEGLLIDKIEFKVSSFSVLLP